MNPTTHSLFVQELTVLDNAVLDAVRGMTGQSWQVDLVLSGALNHEGMVMDFGRVKQEIKDLLESHADHVLLVPAQASWVLHQKQEQQTMVEAHFPDGSSLVHRSPTQAITLLPLSDITASNVAQYLSTWLSAALEEQGLRATIQLKEEPIDGAFYHYCHGLKKHGGNCQRIAHGHRSRLEIYMDGVRSPALEAAWASDWKDIYLGTKDDLQKEVDGINHFAHRSSQGEFALEIPANRCVIVPHDTTVEWIAHHIASSLKSRHPNSVIRVHAFEGVRKGAIAEA